MIGTEAKNPTETTENGMMLEVVGGIRNPLGGFSLVSDCSGLTAEEMLCGSANSTRLHDYLDGIPKIGGCVYLLYLSGLLVYVGETTQLLTRLGSHQSSGKVFDAVRFAYVSSIRDRRLIESAINQRFRPPLNKEIIAWFAPDSLPLPCQKCAACRRRLQGAGHDPATFRLEGGSSIQLSYPCRDFKSIVSRPKMPCPRCGRVTVLCYQKKVNVKHNCPHGIPCKGRRCIACRDGIENAPAAYRLALPTQAGGTTR